MRHIVIAGVSTPDKQMIEILKTALSAEEQARLSIISREASLGRLFLDRVMRRETFESEGDFVAWVRAGMEGL